MKRLEKNPNIAHVYDRSGLNGLHWCARRNYPEIMLELIRCGCFVDSRDYFGRTPLFIAARSNNVTCLRDLIIHRADPWIRTTGGQIPLNVAKGYSAEHILERAMLINIMSRMCPANKKDEVWQNEGVSYFLGFDQDKIF